MKTITALLISCFVLICEQEAKAQTIDFTIRLNAATENYEVYGRSTGSLSSSFNTAGSQIGVVLPAMADDIVLTITSVNGGEWRDDSQNFGPAAQTESDFHSIATVGSDVDFSAAGTEVLLFTFSLSTCLDGVRLFNNASDPGPAANGMGGQDYSNYITDDFMDYTGVAYNNNGTVCSVLPLPLISFNGSVHGDEALLKWTTTEELNLSHFEIQRMNGQGSWESAAIVISSGNYTSTATYSYTDSRAFDRGISVFYRLRMVDTDGSHTWSPIISLKQGVAANPLTVYPNPVQAGQPLQFRRGWVTDNDHIEATIIDIHGKVVRMVSSAELKKQAIHTSGLLRGIYFLRIGANNKWHTEKIIVN